MLDTVVWNVSCCKTFSLILGIYTKLSLVKFIYFTLVFMLFIVFSIATL